MKTPIQWSFDLQDALDVREQIQVAISSGKNLVNLKVKLRQSRDQLHQLVQAFERAGLSEEYGDTYLILFDALAYFADALRFPAVHVGRLRQAANKLDELLNVLN